MEDNGNGRKFEGKVLATLDFIGEKIDGVKKDVSHIYDLIERRDNECRNTHKDVEHRLNRIEIEGKTTSVFTGLNNTRWANASKYLIGAVIALALWFIKSHFGGTS